MTGSNNTAPTTTAAETMVKGNQQQQQQQQQERRRRRKRSLARRRLMKTAPSNVEKKKKIINCLVYDNTNSTASCSEPSDVVGATSSTHLIDKGESSTSTDQVGPQLAQNVPMDRAVVGTTMNLCFTLENNNSNSKHSFKRSRTAAAAAAPTTNATKTANKTNEKRNSPEDCNSLVESVDDRTTMTRTAFTVRFLNNSLGCNTNDMYCAEATTHTRSVSSKPNSIVVEEHLCRQLQLTESEVEQIESVVPFHCHTRLWDEGMELRPAFTCAWNGGTNKKTEEPTIAGGAEITTSAPKRQLQQENDENNALIANQHEQQQQHEQQFPSSSDKIEEQPCDHETSSLDAISTKDHQPQHTILIPLEKVTSMDGKTESSSTISAEEPIFDSINEHAHAQHIDSIIIDLANGDLYDDEVSYHPSSPQKQQRDDDGSVDADYMVLDEKFTFAAMKYLFQTRFIPSTTPVNGNALKLAKCICSFLVESECYISLLSSPKGVDNSYRDAPFDEIPTMVGNDVKELIETTIRETDLCSLDFVDAHNRSSVSAASGGCGTDEESDDGLSEEEFHVEMMENDEFSGEEHDLLEDQEIIGLMKYSLQELNLDRLEYINAHLSCSIDDDGEDGLADELIRLTLAEQQLRAELEQIGFSKQAALFELHQIENAFVQSDFMPRPDDELSTSEEPDQEDEFPTPEVSDRSRPDDECSTPEVSVRDDEVSEKEDEQIETAAETETEIETETDTETPGEASVSAQGETSAIVAPRRTIASVDAPKIDVPISLSDFALNLWNNNQQDIFGEISSHHRRLQTVQEETISSVQLEMEETLPEPAISVPVPSATVIAPMLSLPILACGLLSGANTENPTSQPSELLIIPSKQAEDEQEQDQEQPAENAIVVASSAPDTSSLFELGSQDFIKAIAKPAEETKECKSSSSTLTSTSMTFSAKQLVTMATAVSMNSTDVAKATKSTRKSGRDGNFGTGTTSFCSTLTFCGADIQSSACAPKQPPNVPTTPTTTKTDEDDAAPDESVEVTHQDIMEVFNSSPPPPPPPPSTRTIEDEAPSEEMEEKLQDMEQRPTLEDQIESLNEDDVPSIQTASPHRQYWSSLALADSVSDVEDVLSDTLIVEGSSQHMYLNVHNAPSPTWRGSLTSLLQNDTDISDPTSPRHDNLRKCAGATPKVSNCRDTAFSRNEDAAFFPSVDEEGEQQEEEEEKVAGGHIGIDRSMSLAEFPSASDDIVFVPVFERGDDAATSAEEKIEPMSLLERIQKEIQEMDDRDREDEERLQKQQYSFNEDGQAIENLGSDAPSILGPNYELQVGRASPPIGDVGQQGLFRLCDTIAGDALRRVILNKDTLESENSSDIQRGYDPEFYSLVSMVQEADSTDELFDSIMDRPSASVPFVPRDLVTHSQSIESCSKESVAVTHSKSGLQLQIVRSNCNTADDSTERDSRGFTVVDTESLTERQAPDMMMISNIESGTGREGSRGTHRGRRVVFATPEEPETDKNENNNSSDESNILDKWKNTSAQYAEKTDYRQHFLPGMWDTNPVSLNNSDRAEMLLNALLFSESGSSDDAEDRTNFSPSSNQYFSSFDFSEDKEKEEPKADISTTDFETTEPETSDPENRQTAPEGTGHSSKQHRITIANERENIRNVEYNDHALLFSNRHNMMVCDDSPSDKSSSQSQKKEGLEETFSEEDSFLQSIQTDMYQSPSDECSMQDSFKISSTDNGETTAKGVFQDTTNMYLDYISKSTSPGLSENSTMELDDLLDQVFDSQEDDVIKNIVNAALLHSPSERREEVTTSSNSSSMQEPPSLALTYSAAPIHIDLTNLSDDASDQAQMSASNADASTATAAKAKAKPVVTNKTANVKAKASTTLKGKAIPTNTTATSQTDTNTTAPKAAAKIKTHKSVKNKARSLPAATKKAAKLKSPRSAAMASSLVKNFMKTQDFQQQDQEDSLFSDSSEDVSDLPKLAATSFDFSCGSSRAAFMASTEMSLVESDDEERLGRDDNIDLSLVAVSTSLDSIETELQQTETTTLPLDESNNHVRITITTTPSSDCEASVQAQAGASALSPHLTRSNLNNHNQRYGAQQTSSDHTKTNESKTESGSWASGVEALTDFYASIMSPKKGKKSGKK